MVLALVPLGVEAVSLHSSVDFRPAVQMYLYLIAKALMSQMYHVKLPM